MDHSHQMGHGSADSDADDLGGRVREASHGSNQRILGPEGMVDLVYRATSHDHRDRHLRLLLCQVVLEGREVAFSRTRQDLE